MDEMKYYIECKAVRVWSIFSCESDLYVARLECIKLKKQFSNLNWRIFEKKVLFELK